MSKREKIKYLIISISSIITYIIGKFLNQYFTDLYYSEHCPYDPLAGICAPGFDLNITLTNLIILLSIIILFTSITLFFYKLIRFGNQPINNAKPRTKIKS